MVERCCMSVSYNGLWKLLIDKKKKKTDLINDVGISSSTLAKMSKGEAVSMSILGKICEKYGCNFGDIISYEKEIEDTETK
jgi:DNA-binding Xre family transcriptional regulator